MADRVDLAELDAIAERVWCLQGLDDAVHSGDGDKLKAAMAELRAHREGEPDAAALARAAYCAVMKDLLGRAGIENAFDEIDDDIRVEIDAACVAKATAAIEKQLKGPHG